MESGLESARPGKVQHLKGACGFLCSQQCPGQSDPGDLLKFRVIGFIDDTFQLIRGGREFTLEEQETLNKYDFMDLGRFEFMVRPALGEGDKRGKLRRISIARLDPGIYPRPEWLAPVKKKLMQRDGRPVDEVLAEIEARRQHRLISSATPQPALVNSEPLEIWGQ